MNLILVNAFICRFLFNTADAFTRYTFRPANIFVHEYKFDSCKALSQVLDFEPVRGGEASLWCSQDRSRQGV